MVLTHQLNYLNFDPDKKEYFLESDGRYEDRKEQTIFTQVEIDEMGDITRGFVKEEVKEK